MRSGTGKMLLGSAGLVVAAALFWATGEGQMLLERTERVSATRTLAGRRWCPGRTWTAPPRDGCATGST